MAAAATTTRRRRSRLAGGDDSCGGLGWNPREGLHLLGWGWGLPECEGWVRGFPGQVKHCGDWGVLAAANGGWKKGF